MEFKTISCPVCGAGGNISKIEERGEILWYCAHCAAKFSEESSVREYKKLEETIKSGLASVVNDILLREKTERYYNLRSDLWEKTHAKYIDSAKICHICSEIKEIAPHDFVAEFFELANSADEAQIAEYIQNIDIAENGLFIDLVLDFLIDSLKETYITPVSFLIERAGRIFTPEKRQEYLTKFENEAKKIQGGMYEASLERDVFLAYSSKDMHDVLEILNYIEGNGLTCFAAFRNMQHGRDAVANYEKTLYEAIDNCKIFVFVSSKNSRNYSCDAFKKEIAYIKNQEMNKFPEYRNYEQIPEKYKKLRMEYRLDNEPTPLTDKNLKSFFSGLTYVENFDQLIMRLSEYMEIANSPYADSETKLNRDEIAEREMHKNAEDEIKKAQEKIRRERDEIERERTKVEQERMRLENESYYRDFQNSQDRFSQKQPSRRDDSLFPKEQMKRCNKWVAFLLCYFYLGLFGVHRFYEGDKKWGKIYLFTLGLFGYGWIFDIFRILFKPRIYYKKIT